MPIDDMINALKGKVCVNKLDIHAVDQFSIENSKKVFDFYKSMFEEMKKWAEQESRLANKKAT